jgi:hypothetical protein
MKYIHQDITCGWSRPRGDHRGMIARLITDLEGRWSPW